MNRESYYEGVSLEAAKAAKDLVQGYRCLRGPSLRSEALKKSSRGAAASVAAPRLDCCGPRFPGLAPWATCCRRSAAVPRTFSKRILRVFASLTRRRLSSWLSSERSEGPARATSRGAATACSPARERWDTNRIENKPRSGDRCCPPRLDF